MKARQPPTSARPMQPAGRGHRHLGGGTPAGLASAPRVVAQRAALDEMFGRAIQRRQRIIAPVAHGAGGPVIQRRVGFEFEMGDLETQHWNGAAWVDHQKGAVLGHRPGFDLTADEGVGNSQLEIIIRPIDETNPGQAGTLVNATAPAVVAVVNSITAATFPLAWTQANLIAGIAGNVHDRYRSHTNSAATTIGQLQMTAGVHMAKLYDHASGAQATNYLGTLNPLAVPDDLTATGTLGPYAVNPMAATALGIVNGFAALFALPLGARQQIAAIASMMATLPLNLRTALLPYPKAAAGPYLARTDFSRIMLSLPAAAKNALTPAIMRAIVIGTLNHYLVAAGRPAVNGADPVFPAVIPGPVGALGYGGLTLGTWIGGVVPTPGALFGHNKGRDRMTRRHYPGTPAQRAGLESMGSYGRRRDPGDKPILEFRTLSPVGATDLPGQLQRLVAFLNHP